MKKNNMKKEISLLRILSFTAIFVIVYSILPALIVYLVQKPAGYSNERAAKSLSENKGDNFRFVVFGDNHAGLIFNDSATLKLVRRINREDRFGKFPVDFVAVSGDVTLRGSRWDYLVYNKIRSLIKYPVISARGNHDDDKDRSFFDKSLGSSEMSFSDRNAYFIMIDNTEGDLSEKQFSWLENELEKSSGYKHRFVILHKSPLSPYQQSWYRPEISLWSYRFMKLCEKYKVDMVFAGHEHMYKEQYLGGVRYLISGGGGMLTNNIPTPDGGFIHYLVIRVYGDYVDYEVRKVFPPLWEYLTFYAWKDLFYFLKDVIF